MVEKEWKVRTNVEWLTFEVMAETHDDAMDTANFVLDAVSVTSVEEA